MYKKFHYSSKYNRYKEFSKEPLTFNEEAKAG